MFHYNPSISEDTHRILNLKSGDNNNEVADYIQPIIKIEPRCNISEGTGRTVSGTATMFTTPASKDFYLTGLLISYIKDAACDIATGAIAVTVNIDGTSKTIARLSVLTLTAQSQVVYIPFVKPLKVDKSASISMTGTFAAGNLQRDWTIHGYTVETFKGV